MQSDSRKRPVSGHTFRVERQRGPQWYCKYRLPDGRSLPAPDNGLQANAEFGEALAMGFFKVAAFATRELVVGIPHQDVNGQADAVKLGIARALLQFNAELRKKLKAEGRACHRKKKEKW